MASLSDSFCLSTRVAHSLHLQFLNTPGVLCRVSNFYFLVSRLSTSPRWTSPQASFVTPLTATEEIRTMTTPRVSLPVQPAKGNEVRK